MTKTTKLLFTFILSGLSTLSLGAFAKNAPSPLDLSSNLLTVSTTEAYSPDHTEYAASLATSRTADDAVGIAEEFSVPFALETSIAHYDDFPSTPTPTSTPQPNDEIDRILQQERYAKTVGNAMAIKSSGLRYVRDLYDFSRLAISPFPNPTPEYVDALGNFIVRYASDYIYTTRDLHLFVELERRMRLVEQVIRHKQNGLRFTRTLSDYDILTALVFETPSDTMRQQLSVFIAANARRIQLEPRELQRHFRNIEVRLFRINEALQFRNALLPQVRRARAYLVMARTYFARPTDEYRKALSQWVGTHASHGVQRNSRISVILEIEAATLFVRDSIAVKEAGLKAVHTPADFWELARYAFPNPSPAYQNAVADFIRRHQHEHGK